MGRHEVNRVDLQGPRFKLGVGVRDGEFNGMIPQSGDTDRSGQPVHRLGPREDRVRYFSVPELNLHLKDFS